jgi:hypothetical protein
LKKYEITQKQILKVISIKDKHYRWILTGIAAGSINLLYNFALLLSSEYSYSWSWYAYQGSLMIIFAFASVTIADTVLAKFRDVQRKQW